ncbi:hypothetical protein DICPUDRAFT_156960 [Dictyostelium purpureum]|uniref:Uncharacterized protein n=1 Tax=Dictyostelium purpureum TaxID=5786 RepID=F0ZXW5_DICPU|nr:uncharacterized protein DICPUDRAFT_156960 [Dictyostelium purpureum]EGC31229.1 hypothetical protein DICPUDRAFT_156960 [Dictyostelium purpureum]|eukprot:XP_003292259.1 hypothetical protein DICPUDRAFT_156960 [Dictyostelium purpureum]
MEKEYSDRVAKAEQLIIQSRYIEAIVLLDEAIKILPNDAKAYAHRAEIYEVTEKYDEAIQDYTKVIGILPNCIPAYSSLAACFLNKGLLDKAIQYFNHILVIDGNYLPAHGYLGDIYLKNNQLSKSFEHYKKVLSIDPNHPIGLLGLGDLAVKQNNISDAIKIYRQIIKVTKDKPIEFYHTIRGIDSSDEIQYIRDFKNNPVFSAYVSLAHHLYLQGEYKESFDVYKKITELNPKHATSFSMLASIKLRDGKTAEALEYIDKACELNNTFFNLSIKADVLFDLDRNEEAIAIYKSCLADLLEGENPDPEKSGTRLTIIHNLILAHSKIFESIPDFNLSSIAQYIPESDAKEAQILPNTLYELNNKCRSFSKTLEKVCETHFPTGTIQKEYCESSINLLSTIALGCAEAIQIQHRETQDPSLKDPNYEPMDDMFFDYYEFVISTTFNLSKD